ncbi:MAG: ribulokinase [Spirochaetales bacterium]
MNAGDHVVLGADFGTDSVRVVALDPANGAVLGQGVRYYPRWKQGLFCDPVHQQFRQHPLDYLETLEAATREALNAAGPAAAAKVRALSLDTTGSTPVFANREGVPLSLTPGFESDPDAMFLLWKDHTAIPEAEAINVAAASWKQEKVLQFVGGIYSSEWFWAKAWHVLRANPRVAQAAYTMVEHCDWIGARLTGHESPSQVKRSRCAAGHKGLWHASFGGYPKAFLGSLDPRLSKIADTLGAATATADQAAGTITAEWAAKLGLPATTVIGTGAFDVHMGALGGGIVGNQLVKVMGTSSCDVVTAPLPSKGTTEKVVAGICGQVDGSIVPGWLGYEAGQSAYGDVYAWFRNLLAWPLVQFLPAEQAEALADKIIPALEAEALQIPPAEDNVLALDWLNGRRTPDADPLLAGALTGLKLGTDAPRVYRALVEATAYGSRAIVERFEAQGVKVDGIIAIGGITRKSRLVMQVLSDVLNRSIRVGASDQACALGAGMFAATVAGLYPTVEAAQAKMFPGFDLTFTPDPEAAQLYDRIYKKYLALGSLVESQK